jgi:hypothetical protein
MLLGPAGAVLAILFLAFAAFGPGRLIVRVWRSPLSRAEQCALAFLAGSGVLGLALFLVGQIAFSVVAIGAVLVAAGALHLVPGAPPADASTAGANPSERLALDTRGLLAVGAAVAALFAVAALARSGGRICSNLPELLWLANPSSVACRTTLPAENLRPSGVRDSIIATHLRDTDAVCVIDFIRQHDRTRPDVPYESWGFIPQRRLETVAVLCRQ